MSDDIHRQLSDAAWEALPDSATEEQADKVADVLLPVVERYAAQRAAEALHATADKWQWGAWGNAPRIKGDVVAERIATAQYVTEWLRSRANGLGPRTGGGSS